jgi:hypothetical protein
MVYDVRPRRLFARIGMVVTDIYRGGAAQSNYRNEGRRQTSPALYAARQKLFRWLAGEFLLRPIASWTGWLSGENTPW